MNQRKNRNFGYRLKQHYLTARRQQQAKLIKSKNIGNLLAAPILDTIELTPFNILQYLRESEICVEWQNNPPNIGSIKSGDGVVWEFNVLQKRIYTISAECSANIGGSKLAFFIDNVQLGTLKMPFSKSWHNYSKISIGKMELTKGIHRLSFKALPLKIEGAGNIRKIILDF